MQGRGTTLAYKTTSGGTYTTVAKVINTAPKMTAGEVETTLLSTTTVKQYEPTLPEGEMSIQVAHDNKDPGCIALRAMTLTGPAPIVYWKITWPDGGTDEFQGFSKGYEIGDVENESRITADITVRLTTAITITAPVS